MSVYQYLIEYLDGINWQFNSIFGNNSWNNFNGTSGADVMLGFNGNDIMEGWGGNDYLNGGNGSDFLSGGRGDDLLVGGNGSDFLGGIYGSNVMIGGNGKDTFIFDSRQWKVEEGEAIVSTVVDFEDKLDTIFMYGAENTDFQVVQQGDDVLIETVFGNDIAIVLDAYAEDVCDAIVTEHLPTWGEIADSVNPFDFG